MSFPYLDLAGFKRRTVIPEEYIEHVESVQNGYVAQMIASWSSYINGRLRKRYGNNGKTNHLPLGQVAPPLLSSGTNPPSVTLTGRPTLGSMQTQIIITTGGDLGTAIFKWSFDGGLTFTTGVATAPSVILNCPTPPFVTGMTANFSAGPYDVSNVYVADPPVVEDVLMGLVTLVNPDILRRHGVSYTDPQMVIFMDERKRVMDELKEIADGKDGLWDLPLNEDSDSAITTGGPLGFSDASPYAWTDRQAVHGSRQDAGRFGVGPFPPNKSWVG